MGTGDKHLLSSFDPHLFPPPRGQEPGWLQGTDRARHRRASHGRGSASIWAPRASSQGGPGLREQLF